MSDASKRQAGVLDEITDAVKEAELLIGKWDQESGLTYRELALRLRDIFASEKSVEVDH